MGGKWRLKGEMKEKLESKAVKYTGYLKAGWNFRRYLRGRMT
jgi:hypothetical protein